MKTKTYKIAVIAGDGIGPEVIAEGVKVLEAVAALDGRFQFSFTYFPWGCEFYRQHGKMMDDDGIEQLLVEKQTLTPDLGGSATTQEVGDAIVRMVRG
ncbi:MAG: hypothetical protein J6R89_06485 [Clostridia bacterium]|nr:hypothetical protein [Clostridia bacterium]